MSHEPYLPLRRFVRPIERVRGGAHTSEPGMARTRAAGILSPFGGLLGSRLPLSSADFPSALTLAPIRRERVERETQVVHERRRESDSNPERFGSLLDESPGEGDSAEPAERVLAWRTERVHTRETTVRHGQTDSGGRRRTRDDPPSLTVHRSFPTRVERLTRDVRVVRDTGGATGRPLSLGTAPFRPPEPGHDPARARREPPRPDRPHSPDRDGDARGDVPSMLPPSVTPATTPDAAASRLDSSDVFSLAPSPGTRRPDSGETHLPPLVVRSAPSTAGTAASASSSATTTRSAPTPGTGAVAAGGSTPTQTAVTGDGPFHQRPSATAVEPTGVVDALFAQRTTVDRLVDRLYVEFERKLRIERERRGLRGGR